MNVALTRAKSSLFVIGNGPTLETCDDRWKTIVGDARDRGFFIDVSASLPIPSDRFRADRQYTPSTFSAEAPHPPKPKIKKEKEVPPSPVKATVPDGDAALPPRALAVENALKRKPSSDNSPAPHKDKERKRASLSGSNGQAQDKAPGGNVSIPSKPASINTNGQTNGHSRPPNGSSSRPPPPPSGPLPPAPPPAPPRKAEDVLFIKKKKVSPM